MNFKKIAELRLRYFRPLSSQGRNLPNLKERVIKRMTENLELFEIGARFTCAELFGPHWSSIPLSIRRQAPKEFKIRIAQKIIRGVSFNLKSNGKPEKRNSKQLFTRRRVKNVKSNR